MDEHGVERVFAIPVIVGALLVIPVIVIEESSLGHGWKDAAGRRQLDHLDRLRA